MKIRESIKQIRVGRVANLPGSNVLSAIDKKEAPLPIRLGLSGFDGDEHADQIHHGGPEKAIHFYCAKHYLDWQELGVRAKIGDFGENISLCNVEEKEIFLGDIFSLGTALIQVSQGRQPCWKLNIRFNHPNLALAMQTSGKTGWYGRVVKEGTVGQNAQLVLQRRLQTRWSISDLCRLMYQDTLNLASIESLLKLDYLGSSLRKTLSARLKNKQVEDWSKRLHKINHNSI